MSGYRKSDDAHPFGAPNPLGSSVRPTFSEHADKREADERAQRSEACEGCGRLWRHSLGTGHGWRTVRKPDGRWWHTSCWDRAGQPGARSQT